MCLAIPGQIITIETETEADLSFLKKGKVRFGQILREVNLTLVPEAQVGQFVIVHVGVAISILDENAANEVFQRISSFEWS